MKPIVGALLMMLGVALIGWNVYNIIQARPISGGGFGAGAACLYVGVMWVQNKRAG